MNQTVNSKKGACKMAEKEKLNKKAVYYDVINGKKRYYVGQKVKNKDGYVVTQRLTGSGYRTEAEARKHL